MYPKKRQIEATACLNSMPNTGDPVVPTELLGDQRCDNTYQVRYLMNEISRIIDGSEEKEQKARNILDLIGLHGGQEAFSRPTTNKKDEIISNFFAGQGENIQSNHNLFQLCRQSVSIPFGLAGGSFAMGASCHNLSIQQKLLEAKLHEKVMRLNNLIHHDELTKLPNRIFLKHYLKERLSKKKGLEALACLFIDMDNFSRICDIFGEEISNSVLCAVAKRLTRIAGGSGFVARWETDVFLIVIDNLETRKKVEDMAKEILAVLKKPIHAIQAINHDFYLTASIGLAFYPEDGNEPGSLIRSARVAMRKAKGLGGNAFRSHTAEMKKRTSEIEALEKGLRAALKGEQFCLYYQPQVNLATGSVVGFEALLRWQHPQKGLVQPQQFIPLAEETGLIGPISEWVLRTACEQNKRWQDAGLPPVKIAVNIPASQFRQPNFTPFVRKTLNSARLDPRWLELEITESNVMQNGEDTVALLRDLKSTGLQIAIDDFGAGYSSLAYLKFFPIDLLKLDRFFIRDLTTSERNSSIVRSIIAMAENMNVKIIAEGIETEEQLCFLRQEGCALGQGFLLGCPAPAEAWSFWR